MVSRSVVEHMNGAYTVINQRLTHQRLTHFLKFLEILKILKNIYLKITEDF